MSLGKELTVCFISMTVYEGVDMHICLCSVSKVFGNAVDHLAQPR